MNEIVKHCNIIADTFVRISEEDGIQTVNAAELLSRLSKEIQSDIIYDLEIFHIFVQELNKLQGNLIRFSETLPTAERKEKILTIMKVVARIAPEIMKRINSKKKVLI